MTLTTCGKTIKCPYWDEIITLTGYYKIQDSSTEITFQRSTCPIIENSRLPMNKQSKNYVLMRCPYPTGCHYLNEFKQTVNPDVDGYSQ
jgi:hypothetical protein